MDQSDLFLRGEVNRSRKANPINVPDSVLEGIAKDALDRYSKIFGGKANFLRLLTKEARQDLPPILSRQLETSRRVRSELAGPPLRFL
jgi:hypothetical protein